MRPLSDEERNLVLRIAERLDNERRMSLLADLERACVASVSPDGSRVIFEISGYERPPYRGQHTYGVDATLRNIDGAEVSVLLHADENGRLFEIEFIPWGSGETIRPDWGTLKLL